MGFGSHYVSSPGFRFSTEDYNEWVNKHYPNNNNNDDDEKIIPVWFYSNSLYCDDCEKYIEFVDGVCSNYRSHRLLLTCNYCQKDFKTFDSKKVRCSSCCQSSEQKLKTYTFEKLKKLANVYNMKRRKQEYIIDGLVQKDENYIT